MTKKKTWFFGLLPLIILVVLAELNKLGIDTQKTLVWETGVWAVNFLMLGYFATPLTRITRWFEFTKVRRELGLLAFVYASAHLLFHILFLIGSWNELLVQLTQKPYIVMGFAAWLMLVPLAITSTDKWQKKLKRKWAKLHFLVHPIIILVMGHWIWQIRSDFSWQLAYGTIFVLLIGYRLYTKYKT